MGSAARKRLVYLGPSLPLSAARMLLAADYRPPVRRGDLPARYEGTIVIIDGEFGQSLAVSPKEILRLLDGGTRVVGAASMGALRAAELHSLGMEGQGWVFAAYRSGKIIRDDEVAVTYRAGDYRTLTVPLVNVRYWLEGLRASDDIDPELAGVLLRSAGRIFIADRTGARLRTRWQQLIGPARLARLLAASGGISDVKAADAAAALTAIDASVEPTINHGGHAR